MCLIPVEAVRVARVPVSSRATIALVLVMSVRAQIEEGSMHHYQVAYKPTTAVAKWEREDFRPANLLSTAPGV